MAPAQQINHQLLIIIENKQQFYQIVVNNRLNNYLKAHFEITNLTIKPLQLQQLPAPYLIKFSTTTNDFQNTNQSLEKIYLCLKALNINYGLWSAYEHQTSQALNKTYLTNYRFNRAHISNYSHLLPTNNLLTTIKQQQALWKRQIPITFKKGWTY